ncbi:MAG: tetratricopeptide repeat protein [Candidatus Latescibacteria bacterium]|nr:tetratricopeptide repeat protein [Candidatus Latescibacterota bacterium]
MTERKHGNTGLYTLFTIFLIGIILTGCSATAPPARLQKEKTEDPLNKKAMDMFIEGKVAESKKQFGEAIAAYLEALEYDPKSDEITLALAKALIQDGKILSSYRYTKIVTKLNPAKADAWHLLQYIEQHLGNYEEAAEALIMYMKLSDEKDFSNTIKLAQFYFSSGKAADAKKILLSYIKEKETPAFEMMQVAEVLAANGFTDDAISIYSRIIERDPSDEDAWIKMGSVYSIEGRADEAEQVFREAVEKNPDSVRLMVAIGNQCLEKNDWECAIKWFEKAVAAGEEHEQLKKTLCALYFYAGREDEAQALFNSLKESGEDDSALYFSLGKSMNYLERYEEALGYYSTGLSKIEDKYPEDRLLNVYVGMVQSLVKLDRYEDAITLIRKDANSKIENKTALKLVEANLYLDLKRYDDAIAILEWLSTSDPENIHFMIRLSLAYDVSKQFNKAEDVLLKVLKINPDHALALNNLAYMYMENETNINKAITMVKRALVLDPNNGAYLDTLGWGYYKKGDYKEARKHVENALKIADIQDKGVIFEHLGDIMLKLGNKKEAAEAYNNAIEHGEDREKIQPKLDSLGNE